MRLAPPDVQDASEAGSFGAWLSGRDLWLLPRDPRQLGLEHGLVLVAAELAGGFDEAVDLKFIRLAHSLAQHRVLSPVLVFRQEHQI